MRPATPASSSRATCPPGHRYLRAVTLLELVVAVAVAVVIVGVLSGIATVGYGQTVERTAAEAAESEARALLRGASAVVLLDRGGDIHARWDTAMATTVTEMSRSELTIALVPDESTGADVFAYTVTDDWGTDYAGVAVRVRDSQPETVVCRIKAEGPPSWNA